MNALFEFLPLILFFAGWVYKDIYFALIILMVAMPLGFAVKYLRTRQVDKMYLGSTVLLLAAGALTLYFRNPLFLYWKPTVFYWVIAVAFLGSMFVGDKPLVQRFFGLIDGMNFKGITPTQWRLLNLVWIVFFVVTGLLNLFVAYRFDESTWVKFKVFGLTGLTLVFMIAQTIWLTRFIEEDPD